MAWRAFCGKVWNFQIFVRYGKKNLIKQIFMNFHTQNQGKFKTMTKVSLTFDLRKRSPSWIKKKKNTFGTIYKFYHPRDFDLSPPKSNLSHAALTRMTGRRGEWEVFSSYSASEGAGQRLGSRGRWGLSALEKSLLNFFYFYMFVTWLSSSTNRGYIFYELKWKSLLFFWLLSPFLPSKTVLGWRKTTRETKGGKKSA